MLPWAGERHVKGVCEGRVNVKEVCMRSFAEGTHTYLRDKYDGAPTTKGDIQTTLL
jgi:hypothetical protein